MNIDDYPEIVKLSISEKILLLEKLWDSITLDESIIPIPDSHKKELDKLLATLRIGRLLSLEELKDRVDRRK